MAKEIDLEDLKKLIFGQMDKGEFAKKNPKPKGERLRQIREAASKVEVLKPLLIREGTWAAESLILEVVHVRCLNCKEEHIEHNLFLLAYCVPHRKHGIHTVKYIPLKSLNHHGLHDLPRQRDVHMRTTEFCDWCFVETQGKPSRDILYVDHLYNEPSLINSPVESKE